MIVENERGIQLLGIVQTSEEESAPKQYSPLIASLVLALHGDRVLLVYDRWKKHWELPGGSIEAGESARDCAFRELHEETNQDVRDLELIWVIEFRSKPEECSSYAAVFSGKILKMKPFPETSEIARIGFWKDGDLEELDAIIDHLVRRYLACRSVDT